MTHCMGLMFDEDYRHVVLIEKRKPDFLKGKLNGVGGKRELNERELDCMVREFQEEAGVFYEDWRKFAVISDLTYEHYVHCFFAADNRSFRNARTMEEEEIVKVEVIKRSCILHTNVGPILDVLIGIACRPIISCPPLIYLDWSKLP